MNSCQRRFVIAAVMISGLSLVAAPDQAASACAAAPDDSAPICGVAPADSALAEPQCPEELVVEEATAEAIAEEAAPAVVVEEQSWVIGAAECGGFGNWPFEVTDDGFVALPFSMPGNILSVTGSTIVFLGRTPGAMMGSNKLLALPKAVCTIGVELPTRITGKVVQAFGKGFQAVGRGFAQGVTALATPPASAPAAVPVDAPVDAPAAAPVDVPAAPACASEAGK